MEVEPSGYKKPHLKPVVKENSSWVNPRNAYMKEDKPNTLLSAVREEGSVV